MRRHLLARPPALSRAHARGIPPARILRCASIRACTPDRGNPFPARADFPPSHARWQAGVTWLGAPAVHGKGAIASKR